MIEKNTTINDYQIIDYSNNVVLETEDEFDINTINSFILEFDVKIPKGENYIPKYECDNDSFEHLKALTNKGLNKRLQNNVIKKYQERFKKDNPHIFEKKDEKK